MRLFSINNGVAKKIPSKKIGREKDIQTIFEENLNEILDVNFLATEYSTTDGRIDTLGIDNNGSPVIIEYKRSQNVNVINQGLSYLHWLLDHRATFEALVRRTGVDISVDWKSPRVICVAESYNKYDLDTAKMLHIKIELLKFCIYQNDTLLVEPETQQKAYTPALKVSEKDRTEKVIEKERETITEKNGTTLDTHLSKASSETRRLFEIIHDKIVALDKSIIVEPKARYIAYKLVTNFVGIVVLRSGLRIFLNIPSGELHDPYNIARDLTKPKKIRSWGGGNYDVLLQSEEQISRVLRLIKQSYSHNKKSGKGKVIEKEKAVTDKNSFALNTHLSKASPETRRLFDTIHDKIVALDESIIIESKAKYIAYKLVTNFVDIAVQRHSLRIFLSVPSGELHDPYNIARDLTKPKKIGHWGSGDYDVTLQSEEQINRVLRLIKQSYIYSKKNRTGKTIEKERAVTGKNSLALHDRLSKASPETRRLFEIIHDKIVALDKSIIIEPRTAYIAYKLPRKIFHIIVLRVGLKIYLNVPSGELHDPYNIARDLVKLTKRGHWGSGDYDVTLQSEEQINRVFRLMKQSYHYNKKIGKGKAIEKEKAITGGKTLDDHRNNASPETKTLFDTIHDKVVALDKSIAIEPKARYIAYKLATDFVDITVQRHGLRIYLNVPSGELHDPYNIARDLANPKKIGHEGNGDYDVTIQNEEQIHRVFRLIRQSYTYNKKAQKEKAIKEDNRRTLDYHLSKASPETRTLFDAIHNKIVALDGAISVEPKAVTIAYKLAKVFVDIAVLRASLKIFLNMRSGELHDPYNIADDLAYPKKVGHWGSGDYQIVLQSEGQINQALELIKQSYNHNK